MGAGALGSAFGGMLTSAGHDVTLIGRERYMRPIRDRGLRITGIWGTHIVKDLRALSELEGVVYEPEVIFFC
jgi:ketopantoate reductase